MCGSLVAETVTMADLNMQVYGDDVEMNGNSVTDDETVSGILFPGEYFIYVQGPTNVYNLVLTAEPTDLFPEECDNEIDDDGDDLIDCDDPNCQHLPRCEPPPPSCVDPEIIDAEGVFDGDTTELPNEHQGSCGGSNGPEKVYALQVGQDTPVCIDTHGSIYDTVLYVRESGCTDTNPEVTCNDDTREIGLQSRVELLASSNETYYVYVDSFRGGGPYTLNVAHGFCDGREVCYNERDDDGDGAIDCADPDCASAASA